MQHVATFLDRWRRSPFIILNKGSQSLKLGRARMPPPPKARPARRRFLVNLWAHVGSPRARCWGMARARMACAQTPRSEHTHKSVSIFVRTASFSPRRQVWKRFPCSRRSTIFLHSLSQGASDTVCLRCVLCGCARARARAPIFSSLPNVSAC